MLAEVEKSDEKLGQMFSYMSVFTCSRSNCKEHVEHILVHCARSRDKITVLESPLRIVLFIQVLSYQKYEKLKNITRFSTFYQLFRYLIPPPPISFCFVCLFLKNCVFIVYSIYFLINHFYRM